MTQTNEVLSKILQGICGPLERNNNHSTRTIVVIVLAMMIAQFSKVQADTISTQHSASSSRYFLGNSAMNLKKGEGYYQNTLIALNTCNYGLSDNISIGGGLELFSIIRSFAESAFLPVIFGTAQASFSLSKNIYAGGGLLYINSPKFSSSTVDYDTIGRHNFGVLYGNSTFGNDRHNLTVGLGWGVIRDEFSALPTVSVAGMTRVSNSIAIVTENWLLPQENYNGYFLYGVRFIGERYECDVALINNSEIARNIIVGIPWIDLIVKF